jgi:enoyl-CoA hydratase/carnithine racemase
MDTLLVERSATLPGLMTITLNRPEKLNAINPRMHEELQQVCRALRQDAETRVVILTGSGRAFSAGADLTSRDGRDAATSILEKRRSHGMGNETSALLESLDQVTIGAINGLTIGGAVVFASCLDIRLAAESAWFSIPEVDLDIPLTWNALPRLMRELGPSRTKELVMTCDRFSSRQALEWGFVGHVVPDADLMSHSTALAEKLLTKDVMALALTKSACNALAQMMVPEQATYSDRELLMLGGYLRRERASGPGGDVR